jgi:redox-sensitive bicupin YhaK (pirin superfamily)
MTIGGRPGLCAEYRIMKLSLRRSSARGHADHGWLRALHSFSFADYYDPRHMGFRSLRVINEDRVAPGAGFPTHPHRDMEIFTYVVSGAIAHKDSMGNGRELRPGQIQLMSAGRGVTHSEFNPSATDPLHLLQLWILPRERGLTPSYTEWHPDLDHDHDPLVLIISPDGRRNSAVIQQDADVYRLRLPAAASVTHEVNPGRGIWLQLIHGAITVNGTSLAAGDALSTEDAGPLEIHASSDAEGLLLDLA